MTKKRKKGSRTAALLTVGILVIGGGGWFVYRGMSAEEGAAIEGVPVRRGPLRISVVERANLKAAGSVDLKSEIEGQTTVLWLIEEGTRVEAGQKVCELDTSDLVERRVTQEISVQNAEAAYVKAQQNLAIQVSQNESDIKRAERELEFARTDLTKYLEGDWPQEKQAAEEEIVLGDEELTRARTEYDWSKKLFERGFLEQTQLDADALAKTRAEIRLNQAKRALQLLEEHDFPRQRAELEADVDEKGRELERVKLQARARLVDYEANQRSTKAKFDLESEKLAKLDSQIEKAILIAPVAGMVVYAVESRGRWGGGEPMQEGAQVRERQNIITIPSSEGFIAETSLHESVLEKVDVHQPCAVTIDALPERTFAGQVKFKAVLPDQQSWYANPDLRVYRTEVAVLENDPRMRPGMSCSVEILVDELDDAVYIPVQSVFLDAGAPVAFVSGEASSSKRPLKIGDNNGRFVVVEEGLTAGETVLLSQPAGSTLQPATEKEAVPAERFGPRSEGATEGRGRPGMDQARGKDRARGERPAGLPRSGDGPGRTAGSRRPRGGEGGRGPGSSDTGSSGGKKEAGQGGR